MTDVLAGAVILVTLTGWILLLGFLHADKRERLAMTTDNMLWARENERAKIRAKVETLPGWQHGDAVLREDVLALLDGGST